MVFCIGSMQDAACNFLNGALKELFSWCTNNRLTPLPGKYEVMLNDFINVPKGFFAIICKKISKNEI